MPMLTFNHFSTYRKCPVCQVEYSYPQIILPMGDRYCLTGANKISQ
ncbi:hypothetical protein I8748_20375 [Nostoc sp. CENA67]|uniref:Uncharacterized protein n=1 Tax=Amazonocrinis nigriterrae CENA67 TaxID=2794033 RepID=A0A8J7HUM6_9NOST|nr:hypothetical protein [Amazonocrinis nigriterrae]MBH8564510.1 hypothetical protein [Amazonocrinis nigriterrae CENA67]